PPKPDICDAQRRAPPRMEVCSPELPRPSPVAAAPDCASCSKIGFARGRLVLQQIGKPKISPAPREFLSQRYFWHGLLRDQGVGPVQVAQGVPIPSPRAPRPGAASCSPARLQQSSTRRNTETGNAARRSASNIGAWPL